MKFLGSNEKAINAAVSNQSGTAVFYQYDKAHLNSLHAINKNSVDSLGYAEKTTANEVPVRCLTLNAMLEEMKLSDKKIDLLKIDAQGAEAEILSGAGSSLDKINNITLELNLFDFYSNLLHLHRFSEEST